MSTLLLYAVVFTCICVAVFGAYRLYVWIMDADHGDPFPGDGLTVNAAQAMDLGPMPLEIAHEPRVWEPRTPPAHPPASSPHDAPQNGGTPSFAGAVRLGAAAAAGSAPSSPPLPQDIATHPEQYPFAAWLDDEVAEAGHAITGGAS